MGDSPLHRTGELPREGPWVDLFPLVIRKEGEDWIVGRIDSGEFVQLPPVGGRLLHLLQEGFSVPEAENTLREEGYPEVDWESFLGELKGAGFVRDIRSFPAGRSSVQATLGPDARTFPIWILALWGLVVGSAVSLLLLRPGGAPQPLDLFWSPYLSLSLAGDFGLFFVGVAVHESTHALAARSLGLPYRFSLGTRLTDLVIQTQVPSLWAAPRALRFRVHLSGILWGSALGSSLVILTALAPLPALPRTLLLAWAILIAFSLLWQAQCYMRTDVYFALADVLRCRNLQHDSVHYLKFQLERLARSLGVLSRQRSVAPFAGLSPQEARAVRVYAVFALLATITALLMTWVLALPVLVHFVESSGISIWEGFHGGSIWRTVDGAAALALVLGPEVAVAGILARKAWVARKTSSPVLPPSMAGPPLQENPQRPY